MSEARELLSRVAEELVRLLYEAWHFGDSVAFEGLLAAAEVLDRPEYVRFAQGFARGWAAATPTLRRLDATIPGAALCRVTAITGDALLRSRLLEVADYLAARRTVAGVFETWERSPLRDPYGPDPLDPEGEQLLANPGPGIFVDCLHFDPPFFAELGSLTGDDRWTQLAVDQASAYVSALQADTGLFHHFLLERTGLAYIGGWGRGQGWALLGLLDVIESVPASADLADSARSLVSAMLPLQRPDGHWDAVVTDPGSGVESSTAAFMAVGFARAARLGILPLAEVTDSVAAARSAVLAQTTEQGYLGEVSVAVWASTSDSHYSHVPRGVHVPWGQGPLALMLADIVREEES